MLSDICYKTQSSGYNLLSGVFREEHDTSVVVNLAMYCELIMDVI